MLPIFKYIILVLVYIYLSKHVYNIFVLPFPCSLFPFLSLFFFFFFSILCMLSYNRYNFDATRKSFFVQAPCCFAMLIYSKESPPRDLLGKVRGCGKLAEALGFSGC